MKKIVIPAILTAIVLVAGMFAFMPIDRASTIHTTILAQNMFRITDTSVGDDGTFEIEVEATAGPFCVDAAYIFITDTDVATTETLTLNTIEIDDNPFTDETSGDAPVEIIFAPAAGDDDLGRDLLTAIEDGDEIVGAPVCANTELDFVLEETEGGDFGDIDITSVIFGRTASTTSPTVDINLTPD